MSLRHRWVIFVDNYFLSKPHISHIKSFKIYVSIGHTSLAHILNGNKICLNTTKYMIVNMHDFRYWLPPPFWTVLVRWYPHCVISNKQLVTHKPSMYMNRVLTTSGY